MENRICPACSSPVTSVNKTVIYCSRSCARKHAPRERSGPPVTVRFNKVCPHCKKEFVTRWDRVGCCSKSCARSFGQQGSKNKMWKGGEAKQQGGYIKELSHGHPHAHEGGYVMQHRLVMEKHLGRFLAPSEKVHHKNGVRNDNRIENLELWHVRGESRKDPVGQRFHDLIEQGLRSCPPEHVEKLRADLLESFGFKTTSEGK